MTTERHAAYTRAKKTLDELHGVKLNDEEYELLADAAEGRLLASDAEGEVSRHLFEVAAEKLRFLTDCDRWTRESAEKLLEEIHACAETQPQLAPVS
jgi:hypothetical protein